MLINIEEQNPQLFSFVEELQQIKKLRQGKMTTSNWSKSYLQLQMSKRR